MGMSTPGWSPAKGLRPAAQNYVVPRQQNAPFLAFIFASGCFVWCNTHNFR